MNNISKADYDPFAVLREFRRFLRAHNIQYSIHDWGEDDIVLSFATAGGRYEVCIDDEMIFWSAFEGEELQSTDLTLLRNRIVSAKR